jgi:hypothetical protein
MHTTTISSRNTSHPAIYSAQNQLVQTTRRRLPRQADKLNCSVVMEPPAPATVNPINALCWQTAPHTAMYLLSNTAGLDYCAVTTPEAIMPLRHSPRHKRPSWTTLHASLRSQSRRLESWSRTYTTENDPVPGQAASGRSMMDPWENSGCPDVDGPVAALSKVYLMMRLRLRNTPTGFV